MNDIRKQQQFAEAWPDMEFVQRYVAQIPRRSNSALLVKGTLRDWEYE